MPSTIFPRISGLVRVLNVKPTWANPIALGRPKSFHLAAYPPLQFPMVMSACPPLYFPMVMSAFPPSHFAMPMSIPGSNGPTEHFINIQNDRKELLCAVQTSYIASMIANSRDTLSEAGIVVVGNGMGGDNMEEADVQVVDDDEFINDKDDLQDGSGENVLEDGSGENDLEDRPSEDDLENGSGENAFSDGYDEGDLDDGYDEGDLDDGYDEGDLDDASGEGDLEDGSGEDYVEDMYSEDNLELP